MLQQYKAIFDGKHSLFIVSWACRVCLYQGLNVGFNATRNSTAVQTIHPVRALVNYKSNTPVRQISIEKNKKFRLWEPKTPFKI